MVYLDNAATTHPKFMRSQYKELWMNSNTSYTQSKEQKALNIARNKIKKCLGVKNGYVLFFRNATEAIQWLANKFCTDEVWCSPYEHNSVYDVSDGILTEETKNKFDLQEYSLYCHQLVNQITGTIWDIKSVRNKFITRENQFFGVDLTASIGHTTFPTDLEEYCDALWFSGHKIYTEKNIGAMWISDKLGKFLRVQIDPKNQYNLVHGTVDVQGVMALSNAIDCLTNDIFITSTYNSDYYYNLSKELCSQLHEAGITLITIRDINDGIVVYDNKNHEKSWAINAVYLPKINADALQTYLASKDIYVGTAHSACSTNSDYRILEAMGIDKQVASQIIRVSFGIGNDITDISQLVKYIKKFKEMF